MARVVPPERLLPEALGMAARIGALSAPAVAKAKDCVNRAYETGLSDGLRYELCALPDCSFASARPSTHDDCPRTCTSAPLHVCRFNTGYSRRAMSQHACSLVKERSVRACCTACAGGSSGAALRWQIRRRAWQLFWRSGTPTSRTGSHV